MKDLVLKGVEELTITNVQELDNLMYSTVASKNRYLHRGGFSPCQLVFGQNPRLPHDLLGDDAVDAVGLGDLRETAWDADTAASEFARA